MKSAIMLSIAILFVIFGFASPNEVLSEERNFFCEKRWGWNQNSNECPCKEDWKPTDAQFDKILEGLLDWKNKIAPDRKSLQESLILKYYMGSEILETDLNFKNKFQSREIRSSVLNKYRDDPIVENRPVLCNVDLSGKDLTEVGLRAVNLTSANLSGTELKKVDLSYANLQDANLEGANLTDTTLTSTVITGAKFSGANFSKTRYEPDSSGLPNRHVEGLKGLKDVIFQSGRQSGLVGLRKFLKDAGQRELEREATYAIERNKVKNEWKSKNFLEKFGGSLKFVFFEQTTCWGHCPEKALFLMLIFTTIAAVFYRVPIAKPDDEFQQGGIYLIWPRERLKPNDKVMIAAVDIRVERLHTGSFVKRVFWALYFSILSAFHIGWRDLNLGAWISRLQPTEFYLRGIGWVRVLSGLQSLISVFLIAIWALTYFGRPFG